MLKIWPFRPDSNRDVVTAILYYGALHLGLVFYLLAINIVGALHLVLYGDNLVRILIKPQPWLSSDILKLNP